MRRLSRRTWTTIVAGAMVTVLAIVLLIAGTGGDGESAGAEKEPLQTGEVERGKLSAMVALDGTLSYRAELDGSPYSLLNQTAGIYTELPATGDRIGCGDVLYRIDDDPVVLLCGALPAYRDLEVGDGGDDVAQLNRNLRRLGYDRAAGVEIGAGQREFTWETQTALKGLQVERELDPSGVLTSSEVAFLPGPVRIAKVTGRLGGTAQPGTQVAQATSDILEVRASLDASQQGEVKRGDAVRVTLPGNRSAKGRVDRLGRIAETSGQDEDVGAATIPVHISLDDPRKARGLDAAPVQADIATTGVKDALSVPVTALIGDAGGGMAVEVVREGGRSELVSVELGMFDTAAGRVAVKGDLAAGDQVVVPSL